MRRRQETGIGRGCIGLHCSDAVAGGAAAVAFVIGAQRFGETQVASTYGWASCDGGVVVVRGVTIFSSSRNVYVGQARAFPVPISVSCKKAICFGLYEV